MNLNYKRATLEDIDILTETRIEVLRAANKLSADTDMSEVERRTYNYYQKALCDGSHIAYLIFDENRFVGAGGVSFFQVMPTYHNPNGNKAYIMNMYANCGQTKIKRFIAFCDSAPNGGGSGTPCGACQEFFYQLNEANEDMEIMVDYEKRETVTLKELMPNWWGKERYAEAKSN